MHEQCLLRIGMALRGGQQQVLLRLTKDHCSQRFGSHASWLAKMRWIELRDSFGEVLPPPGMHALSACAHVIYNEELAVSYHADPVSLTGILSLLIFMQAGWQRSLG